MIFEPYTHLCTGLCKAAVCLHLHSPKLQRTFRNTAQRSTAQHSVIQHGTAQHGRMQGMTVEDTKLTWGLWRTRNSTQNLPLQHHVDTAKCQQHDSTAHAFKLVLPHSFLPAQAVSAGPHSQKTIPTPQAARSDVLGNLLNFLGWVLSLKHANKNWSSVSEHLTLQSVLTLFSARDLWGMPCNMNATIKQLSWHDIATTLHQVSA